jgi:dihydropteroate synthase
MAQQRPQTWLAGDQALPVGERVLLMAELNVTPDSFSDGGRFRDPDHAVASALEMVQEGADLLDIGGESSRPGSHPVSLEEELDRVVPIVAKLAGRVRVPISIDTTKAEVARQCLDHGASVINDISALRNDPEMGDVVSRCGAGLILMHMQGIPATMQRNPSYADVVEEVYDFLRCRTEAATALGIDRDRIAVDPGIGFGKRLEDNLTLLSGLSSLTGLGRPIVIGPSRKGFLGALLQRPVVEREWGTAAAVAAAVLNGAHIVRVHAVPEMREVIRVSEAIRAAGAGLSVPTEGLQKERS